MYHKINYCIIYTPRNSDQKCFTTFYAWFVTGVDYLPNSLNTPQSGYDVVQAIQFCEQTLSATF